MDDSKPVTPERLMQLAWGYAPPLMLEAAIQLKVFDSTEQGAKSLDQLTEATGASKRGLRNLLDGLVGLDFLRKDAAGKYVNSPESSAFLVSTKPSFQGAFFRHISGQLMPKWLTLTETVRTGKPSRAVNQTEAGAKFFEDFVEALFPLGFVPAQRVADAVGVPKLTSTFKVLDIAAGSGVWGIGVAVKSPHVQVTAVDWPGVIGVTKRVAARHNLSDRFSFIEGDIGTADFGNGYQLATLGHILHSEGESRSRQLLAKVYAALASGGTIAIAEFLVNDQRTAPPQSLIFAVNMLVNTDDGDAFSFEQIQSWLTHVGFRDVRSLDAPEAPSPLILATKP